MALLTKEKRRQAQDYANYEQQAPERDVFYRQATGNMQQGYVQNNAYNNFGAQYSGQYNSMPQYNAQPNVPPQFVASFYQDQANQFVSGGYTAPQYNFDGDAGMNRAEQYRQDMLVNQNYDYSAQAKRISEQRSAGSKKKNINSDMIKIVVTIMVVALAICGLLIANQFISGGEVAAESGSVQAVDGELIASAATVDGSVVMNQVETIPDYEYEQSTNWFDKLCDFLGGKLN